ncbi:hypothetical protein [Halostagnicola kamekurae]|uniref:Uncharacterized protein n=1 Tax=Halostagnicola kamekurae TaxID=619731 RepID=A0A1I6UTJ4_9EURY|nr:hypothetical protein [Halostagnicola kamekurae]SFT04713.1 hypothetical protein SAMN04488556_4082 [Halostagnicola kamekurae]
MDWAILGRVLSEEKLERVRNIWEEISPHPVIASHPILTLAGIIAAGIYWYTGTPIEDLLYYLSIVVSLIEALWNWVMPSVAQSLFANYPGLRLIAVLAIIGLWLRTRDKGVEHVVAEDIGPAVGSVLGAIGKIPVVVVGGLASTISENRGFISDILSGLISSFIFKALIAVGTVGAAITFLGL